MKALCLTLWLVMCLCPCVPGATNTATAKVKAPRPQFDLFAPLRLKGVDPDKWLSYSNHCRAALVLDLSKWLGNTRHIQPTMDLDRTPIDEFNVVAMTNAMQLIGFVRDGTNRFFVTSWCSQLIQFDDIAQTDFLSRSEPKLLAKMRCKVSESEALKIANGAFEAASIDPKPLRFGPPKIERLSASDADHPEKVYKLPGYTVTWKDEQGGAAICIVSGITQQIVKWGILSHYIPNCPSKWYYQDLGITNIPPIDAGSRLR
jgi:hypothetical protein